MPFLAETAGKKQINVPEIGITASAKLLFKVQIISKIWLTTIVILAAGAMPLARTKLKYSRCPRKMMIT